MGRDLILGLIPHAGAMCLLDDVLSWDAAGVLCRSASHRDPANPLRRDGRLSALHLIEYAAQAMAVHGGLLARAAGESAGGGLLAAVRDMQLHVETLDDIEPDLQVSTQRRVAGATGSLYDFEVRAQARLLASGRLSVIPERKPDTQ